MPLNRREPWTTVWPQVHSDTAVLRAGGSVSSRVYSSTSKLDGWINEKWIGCAAALWGWCLALSSAHQHNRTFGKDGPEVIMAPRPFPVGQLGAAPFFWWECDRGVLPCQLASEPETSPKHALLPACVAGVCSPATQRAAITQRATLGFLGAMGCFCDPKT